MAGPGKPGLVRCNPWALGLKTTPASNMHTHPKRLKIPDGGRLKIPEGRLKIPEGWLKIPEEHGPRSMRKQLEIPERAAQDP